MITFDEQALQNLDISQSSLATSGFGWAVLGQGDPGLIANDFVGVLSITQPVPTTVNPNAFYGGVFQTDAQGNTGTVAFVIGAICSGSAGADSFDNTGKAIVAQGVVGSIEIGPSGTIQIEADAVVALSPIYNAGCTTPVITNGLLVQDQGGSWASNGIHILSQTSPGKAIVVDGGESDFQSVTLTGLLQPLSTLVTSSDLGIQGQIKWDADYIYVCTATNTWKRAALSTF